MKNTSREFSATFVPLAGGTTTRTPGQQVLHQQPQPLAVLPHDLLRVLLEVRRLCQLVLRRPEGVPWHCGAGGSGGTVTRLHPPNNHGQRRQLDFILGVLQRVCFNFHKFVESQS